MNESTRPETLHDIISTIVQTGHIKKKTSAEITEEIIAALEPHLQKEIQ